MMFFTASQVARPFNYAGFRGSKVATPLTRRPGDRWTLSAAKGTPGGSSHWQTTHRRNAHPLRLAEIPADPEG